MCGIFGTLNRRGAAIDQQAAKKMLDTMAHRGPDGSHLWFSKDKSVCLGHRRLSIIDLTTTADQPMTNEDSTIWIVFNGEIYNHAEIRPILESKGHRFKTDHSDTEVIIHAYEQWGERCVDKLQGMFGLAIWDTKKDSLWIARDRLGIKPLYYLLGDHEFAFASELKALLPLTKERNFNYAALPEYLVFRSTLAPNTMVSSINKMDKGESFTITRKNNKFSIEKKRYYDINHTAGLPTNTISYNDALDQLDALFKKTIRSHLNSDAPLCLFLSGGVDSSLVAAIAATQTSARLKAFTIGMNDPEFDESGYAKYVAEKLKLDITIKKLTVDALEFVDQWLAINDDLLSDPSSLALYLIAKEAHDENFKVALTGEGSDEFFGGYEWSYQTYRKRLSMIKSNPLPPLPFLSQLLYKLHPERKTEEVARILSKDIRFFGTAEVNTPSSLEKLFHNQPLKHQFIRKVCASPSQTNSDTKSLLLSAMLTDINFRLPNDVLCRTDKATMGHGIEARVPFMDHLVAEFAFGLPIEYKLGKNLDEPKKIIKDLACRYFNKDFINRPKMGFPIPVGSWMKDKKIKEEFCQYIEESKINYLDYSWTKKIYNEHLNNKVDSSGRLFNLFLLERYIRKWKIVL